jgi:hypothetical protein
MVDLEVEEVVQALQGGLVEEQETLGDPLNMELV